jgi:hypothetical protein
MQMGYMNYSFAKSVCLTTAILVALAGATAILEMKVPSLIFGFLLIPAFISMIVSIHVLNSSHKMMSMVGVVFSGMYGVLISLNYALEMSFIGRQTPVPDAFNMENPESIFWTIEVLGYFFMGLSTGILVPMFHSNITDRAIQLFFLINAVLGVGGLIGYWMDFPLTIMLGGLMVWNIVMPIAAILVFFYFKNMENDTQQQLN